MVKQPNIAIYQAENGSIELKTDSSEETFWANQKQIAELFCVERSVVTKHIKNIYKDKEVDKDSTCAFFAQVRLEGKRTVKRNIEHYSLDIILAVGYRSNSAKAIAFRKWATQTLKQNITHGYSINPKILQNNKELFLKTLTDLKILSQNSKLVEAKDVLSLIQSFSTTFFNLESYDKDDFPKQYKH